MSFHNLVPFKKKKKPNCYPSASVFFCFFFPFQFSPLSLSFPPFPSPPPPPSRNLSLPSTSISCLFAVRHRCTVTHTVTQTQTRVRPAPPPTHTYTHKAHALPPGAAAVAGTSCVSGWTMCPAVAVKLAWRTAGRAGGAPITVGTKTFGSHAVRFCLFVFSFCNCLCHFIKWCDF